MSHGKRETGKSDFPGKKPKDRPLAVLGEPVHSWLSDTTAHGLGRLVGSRPIYVKVIWLVGFALCLTGFVTQVQSFIKTFNEQPETTTLQQNSVEFEFPDLVICNKAIMSGSYPYILDPNSTAMLNSYVTQLTGLMGVAHNQTKAALFAMSLLSTIEYHLISKSLGHKLLQMLFLTTINGMQLNAVPATEFYSPSELNCIRVEPTPDQRKILSTEGSYLEVGLFLDAAFFDFPKNSSLLPIPIANSTGINFLAWDFENGINLEGASGVNVYFARPGHYPDSQSMIQLSSGKEYRIDLEIERLILGKGMQCLSSPEPSRIISPYDYTEITYAFSESLCRAERSNRLMMERSGCVSHLLPRERKFGNLSNCRNASRVFSGQISPARFFNDLINGVYSSLSLDQKAIQQYCTDLRPCQTDRFRYRYSFSNWPRIFSSFQRDILARFQELVKMKQYYFPHYQFPGYEDMIKVAGSMLNNLTTHNIVIGRSYLNDQVIRVRIFTSKSFGSAVQIEKSYDLTNLIADTGGLLGLYVGCSLLTMLEAVELLHDCLIASFIAVSKACNRKNAKKIATEQSRVDKDSRDADGYDKNAKQHHRSRNDSLATISVTELET